MEKVYELHALGELLGRWDALRGEPASLPRPLDLVHTNGCFDLLHIGHVRLLEGAKAMGHFLVVSVNDDFSVRALKGEGRPFHPLTERMEMLAALRCVDFVTWFKELDPRHVLEVLRPEVHVKGGDYRKERMVETKLVESYGGRVEIFPVVEGRSTTRLAAYYKGGSHEAIEG